MMFFTKHGHKEGQMAPLHEFCEPNDKHI